MRSPQSTQRCHLTDRSPPRWSSPLRKRRRRSPARAPSRRRAARPRREPLPRSASGSLPSLTSSYHTHAESDFAPAHASGTLACVRVLIAEDETIIRLDLKDLLERAGFEVCAEAKDGLEAVELARSEQPDVVVLDVKMPRLDGIEAARRILDERPIPIVML